MISTGDPLRSEAGRSEAGLGDGGSFGLAAGKNLPDRGQYLAETGCGRDDQRANGQGISAGPFEARYREVRRLRMAGVHGPGGQVVGKWFVDNLAPAPPLLAERGNAKLVESGEIGRCESGRRVTGALCSRSGHDVFII